MSLRNLSKKRRTKIVCTIGPATSSEKMLKKLVLAGMDCARLNFSHGEPSEHLEVIRSIRKIDREIGKETAILQDLPGPKFRVGVIPGGSIQLKKGAKVTLTSSAKVDSVPIRDKDLPRFAKVGGSIFLSDGSIRLKILDTTSTDITCRCEIGGTLLSGKGINIPDLKDGFETFTKNDRTFLAFGLEHGVDLVAVSFVRKASDILSVRKFMGKTGIVPIVAKIEKKEAVSNIEDIARVSEAVMVARGDLGVENPLVMVPELQKDIISKCLSYSTPVITATQMLESMVKNPNPTRAEVTDVANAIFDGTDAVMLSEETAVGSYPIECVRTLEGVAINAEARLHSTWQSNIFESPHQDRVGEAIGRASAIISDRLEAKAIVMFLDQIEAVSKVSRLRPEAPIITVSDDEKKLRRLKLVWGVYPLLARNVDSENAGSIVSSLRKEKLLEARERATLVCLDRGNSKESAIRMQVIQC
jgi:pyruvate kinase